MIIENREQYRNLLDALAAGDRVGDDTHAAMVAFAKVKKIKHPPVDNPAPVKAEKEARAPKVVTVCKEKGCDRSATSLGLCKKHHTAHWRQDPVNLEKTRLAARKHSAKKRLTDLAARVPGFNPNKSGAGYASLPDGITAERIDQIIDEARGYGLDVYAITL